MLSVSCVRHESSSGKLIQQREQQAINISKMSCVDVFTVVLISQLFCRLSVKEKTLKMFQLAVARLTMTKYLAYKL